MDPLTQLYQRLRTQWPAIEAWLEYWDDEDTDLGNLRTLEHWLSQMSQAK
jgi:hypothetical protein